MANKKGRKPKKRGKYKSNLRGYAAYSANYDKVKAKMEAKGDNMASEKLNEVAWKEMYNDEKRVRQEAMEAGTRKSIGDINREIIKEQTYSVSQAQASGYVKQMRKMDKDFEASVEDVRAGKVKIDEVRIANRYNEVKKDSGWLVASKTISQEFFGSE